MDVKAIYEVCAKLMPVKETNNIKTWLCAAAGPDEARAAEHRGLKNVVNYPSKKIW